MAKSDDILKKYGITQVRGSEKGTGTTGGNSYSSGATGTGVKKADDILSKYGIAQVRGKTGDFDKWKKDSEDIISRITSAGEHDETSMAQMYQLMAAGSNYRDQYRDDAETAGYIDSVVSRIAKAESYASEAKDRYARVTSPIEDWDMYAGKRGWESYTSETAQRQQALAQEEEDKKWWEKLLGYLGEVQDTSLPTGSVQKVIDDVREDTSYREPTDEWTNGERYIFGYLYQTDKSQAYHYAASVNEAINKEKEEEQLKKIAESAADGFWSGAAHTAGAIATAPLGLADYLSDLVYANAGKPIRSDGTVSPFEYSQAVTGGISEKLNEKYGTLNEKIPVIGGKGLGDVYGLGTSVAQSALAGYTGGQLGTLVQFFGSAAAAGVDEAKQRGATDEQALQMGTLSGAAEGLAEMIGVDNLLKIGSSATMRQLLTNLVKQGAAEGIEEGLTTLMNNFADQWVMKDKSNFNALVRQFMENGMSEEAAKKQAWLTMANDLAFDVVAGFASGVAHAGPQTVTQTVIENVYQPYQAGKAILESEGSVDALKQLANEVAGVSSADTHQAIADKIGKVDEKASALRVGKLYDTVRSANNIANASANQADIAEFLESKGFDSQKAKAVAEALVARYNGQELTKAQTKTLASVKGNADVKAAISNIVTNAKSTMGQRSDNIRAFNKDVTIGRIAKANSISAEQARKIAEGKMSTQEESLPDSHYEVSADGKTIDKDGNIVTIQGIASLENGRMVLQTENGTVDAKDLHYSSQGEALVYEAVANLEGIIDTNTANKLSKHLMKLGDASSDVYVEGIVQAYTYGYYGYGRDAMTGENTLSATLSEKQRNVAYGLGEQYRNAKTGADQANAATATVKKTAQTGKSIAPDGTQYQKVRFEGKVKKWGKKQKAEVALVDFIASNFSGNTIHVFESYKAKNGKYVYEDSNGKIHAAPNGMYIDSTGDIYLDLNAGNHGEGLVMNTFAHELYHHIQKHSPEKARKLAEFLVQELGYESVEAAVQRQIDKAEKAGHGVAHFMESGMSRSAAERMVYDRAFNDFVADSLETMFTEGDAIGKLQKLKSQDEGLFNMIKDFINKWVKKLREFYRSHSTISIEGDLVRQLEKFEQIQQMFVEALVDAGENYQSLMTMEENTDAVPVEEVTQYSYRSLAEAAGFEAVENEDGTRSFLRNGVKVSEVTVDDIEHSPIGAFINYSLAKNDISAADAKRQKKMFADICTMACKTNDFSMTMQFVGSAVFTGMKANADKQYGTTYDFPSICTKTQAVIDAMSKRMVKLGRGLSSEELVKLYQDVFASGNPVPCPECYVFSRWIGIGGMLDNIKKYQDFYGDMDVADVAKAYRTMRDEVAAFAEEQGISFGKAKGALTSKLTKEYNKLTEKIEKAQNQGEKVKPADQKRLDELEPMMNTVKGMTWLENVYFADSTLNKVNPRFRVPDSVLFDLNNGEAFATQYKEAWAFRTTQGAGYGKAITPYAEARLGEGILVTNNTTNAIKGKAQGSLDNFFLKQNGTMDKKAREALDRARLKQKIQAFIGGQRFQSTSDARYENASDYLLAALEMQAMHGMVQVYTKVDGAVPALANWNYSINQSLMPLGGGLDANGNVKDTSVGGMNRDIAFRNREKFETAGTITIGVNDNHIRAMFQQWVRDFIIPYHASGGKADVVAEFRRIQEGQEKRGQMVRSTDYSRTQGDKVLSDEVLRWQGKSEAEIQRIHAVRDARIAILTGGKPNMDVVRSNRFLSALYDKLNGGEWDKVKLAKSKVESQIYPNEFWDQTVSYEDSGNITRDYLEYCNDLGFLHRFSGLVPSNGKLVPVKGYDQNGERVVLTDLAYKYDEDGQKTDQIEEYFWKVLTDRRMYDNQGKYLPQKVVTLNDTTPETVTTFAKGNYGRQYDKELSMKTAEEIAGSMYSDRVSDKETLDFLNKQLRNGEVTEVYRAMAVDGDGNLYPPMAGYVTKNGKKVINGHPSAIGEWEQSTESIPWKSVDEEFLLGEGFKQYAPTKEYPNGRFERDNNIFYKNQKGEWKSKFRLEKDNGTTVDAAYAPYIHTSLSMLNDQFTSAYKRENLVVVRGYVPNSEVHGVNGTRYQANFADKPVGRTKWHSGVVAAQMPETRTVILSRYFMPIEIVDDAVMAQKTKEMMKGNDIEIPYNVVTPRQRRAMEKIGIRIGEARGLKDAPKKADVVYSDRDYSYEALVSKPDMVVTEVGGNVPTNRADIVAAAKKNATSVGRFDPKTGSVSVHVKDIGKDVVLGTVGLKHGLDGRRTDNAIVTVKAGEILRNSIRINELTPKKEEAHGSYVLIGAASGSNGDLYIVRSVVNTFKHELESMEVLYAINAKKGNRLRSMRPGFQGPVTDSTISIAELLDYVNEYFPDILPEEVLKHYGYDARPEGSLGEDALYSDRDNAPTFYSQMAKVVDGVKQEKLGAASVVSMLRGKGVKAEEIKWSGIETWLEGKKSVTKAELQEFIAGSMLQIEEETLTNDEIPYTDDQQKRITEHTAKRDEIAQELAEVWKQVTGNDFPIQNVGAGLESAVESKIRDVNLEKKKASFEGRLLEKLRKDLKEVIANNDDFGFDSWKEALISIHRHRKSFIDHYELSSTDKAVIVKYCNALNAYNELPNQINELDTMRLRRIAHEAELYNRKIGDVRSEHYAENAKRMTKWGQYKLKGGNNYREILFKIPGSYYYNDAMAMHWDERDGVLAHARIQDLNTFLGKMLFVEEIQSDWHNEGHKEGYDSDKEAALKKIVDLREQWNSLYSEMLEANAAEARAISAKMDAIDTERASLAKKVRNDNFVPDAPFKDNYHEYVLKRLLREAAEQDYDSIGWTTAETQDERWANNRPHKEGEGKSGFLKGYTIEYDQDIPKFLNKYGKKWGTRVGKTTLDSGTEIWSMAITDEMKESVLTEGQPLYSDRIDTSGMDSEATKIIRKLEIRAIGSRYDKGKYASYSAERIERELSRSSATKMDYAKSYIAWVNPEDFLYATTTSQAGRDQIEKEAGDLDLDRLRKETQPIHLTVDFETGKIVGHEGRHRMTALYKAGVEKVAVIFDAWNDDRYNTKPVNMMEIVGQEFDRYHSGIGFYVHDMLPLSRRYADATRKLFSEVDGSIKFSERSDDSVSNRSLLANAFEGVAQNDIERNKIQEYKGKISLINAEERKLSELNEKIRELSFAKGPKDTKAIRDLQFEARQTANRINTYDKQLLRLEASKPLQDVLAREKKLAYQKAEKKGKEALAAYKERAAKTQRELMDRWQESRKHGIENREKTFMRHKIQSVVGELNQLLLSNDKKRHVPDSLKKAVADALALVNMDTVGAEERAAKYAALIAKETDPDKIDAYTVTMENILRQGDKMGQRLKELRDAYEEIQESDDPDIANAYDPVIAGSLKELAGSIGNTSLRNMTIEQLSDVYDMYKMVLTRVRDANKSFLNEKKEAISALASRVVGEVRVAGGEHKYRAAFLDFARKFGWNNLKPVYAFEHIGSSTLTGAFNNVRAGEDVWAIDVTEAREYYLDKSKKYGYDSWDFKKKYRFESASGLEFDLTLDQILSLYAYSKREQAYDHLKLGGFVFDSNIETYTEKGSKLIKYRVNTADAHQITPDILASIISKLSGDQMGFVDEMQDYLSTVMGAKGNEVTMKMYGVKLFKEKFYFPLKSAKQFMFEQNEVSGEVKIKNSGFTNKVVAKANNPVILSNFMDVWSGHVNDMSMYHAFVLPLEDFNRIFNYNSPKQEGQPPVSVKGTIQSAYTPAAVNYVRQLITDLNGGARSDPATDILNKLMGLFKKGSVFASLSVVVQQPSAVARAAALVDTKYFIGPKVDHKRHKALWDEVKKYAPVAIIKEMGYFDTNMGKSTQDFIQGKEYSGFNEKMKALVTDSGYRDEALSKAPALADEIAWCSIWEAVKREMRDKHKGLDVKSEPFLMLCGSRFTEVITKTQVYDSVLSRSGLMRSKDTGLKMATAFMAEPTTSINMIADALLQGKRGNRKYCGAAIGAVVASQILNSILVSFVYAGRDDDEDETYAEKYIGTLTGEILDSLNPAGYIPFIKDIQSIAKGYDVERSDMAVFSDLVNAYKKLSSDKLSVYRKVEGFAGSIAQILGLPVKNIMRDARGIYQTIMSFVNGQQTTKSGIGYAVKESLPGWMGGGDTSNQQQLYEAYLSGDQTHISRVKSRFKDQSAIDSAIRKALRENDPRIKEAAIAWNANDLDEYMRLAKAIIAEKHFSQDNVVMAIRAEASALEPGAETSSTSKVKGLFTAEKFAEAIAQGDEATANAARMDIIQTEQKNGKTEEEAEKSFVSSAKSELKELFMAGGISEDKAVSALTDYCGIEEQDAMADVQYWAFKKNYPDVYADDSWFDKYYKEIADTGIDIDVYMNYRGEVKNITGDGKKERRMAVIDSLPITSAQKDAMYFAEGWAASTLSDAPWR